MYNSLKFLKFPVDDLASLSNNPQFLALRQLIQQNPEQLQTLMQTLQANQPELFQVRKRPLSIAKEKTREIILVKDD